MFFLLWYRGNTVIVNELYNEQGLGNQLWNYVVTRVIAKKNGYDFCILKKDRFKGKDFMDLDFGTPVRGGITSRRGYLFRLPDGITHYYSERRELFGAALSDTSDDISRTDPKLLDLPACTKFDGNCQSTHYLKGYKQDILEWLHIKDEYLKHKTAPNVCVIHLRCGDFMQLKSFLPVSYYKNAMAYVRSIDPGVVFQCVTDQKEKAEELLPGVTVIGAACMGTDDTHRAAHHRGGPVGVDFCLMKNARYVIMSNSSLSWWAAYLNTEKVLAIAPKYWARFNVADGFWAPGDIVTDEFTYLDRDGKIFSATQCDAEKKAFEEAHEGAFNADNELNKVWKKPRFLLSAYVAFAIKKIPTLKKRLLSAVFGR